MRDIASSLHVAHHSADEGIAEVTPQLRHILHLREVVVFRCCSIVIVVVPRQWGAGLNPDGIVDCLDRSVSAWYVDEATLGEERSCAGLG